MLANAVNPKRSLGHWSGSLKEADGRKQMVPANGKIDQSISGLVIAVQGWLRENQQGTGKHFGTALESLYHPGPERERERMLQDLEAAVSADEGQDGSRGFQHQSSWGQSWESASLRSLPHSHLLSASPMGWTLSDIIRTGQCPVAQTRVERESGGSSLGWMVG